MKDYSVTDATVTPVQTPGPNNWEMHGVTKEDRPKPFRRRSALRGFEPPLQDEADSRRNLPATLPQPWDQLRHARPAVRKHILARAPLVNFFRETPTARSFDLLRTRLSQAMKQRGWKRLAVVAPTPGCGATFSAVNLALSLARVPGSRTILMDLNQRDPGVGDALDIHGVGDTAAFLSGELPATGHLVKCNDTLALGLTDDPDHRAAAERLHSAECAQALDRMCDDMNPDQVLFDLPPVLGYDDFSAFLPRVDAVLLVADATRTTAAHIAACEDVINGHSQLLGVVLNRARRGGVETYDA